MGTVSNHGPIPGVLPRYCDHREAAEVIADVIKGVFGAAVSDLKAKGMADTAGAIGYHGVVACPSCGLMFNFDSGLSIEPTKPWKRPVGLA